jgi:hypothetical protein
MRPRGQHHGRKTDGTCQAYCGRPGTENRSNDHMNDTEYAPAADTTARVTPRIRELARALLADPLTEQLPYTRELAELVGVLLARPITDQTVNAGKIVRHVIDGKPAEPGYLRSWWVAAEDPETGEWVTWEACALEGGMAGQIGYNGGDYFSSPDAASNKRRALRSLARRAGVPVAPVNMDEDEAISQLTSQYGPYRLAYKAADALMVRAAQREGLEVADGPAGLTARKHGSSALRYDLRERTTRR